MEAEETANWLSMAVTEKSTNSFPSAACRAGPGRSHLKPRGCIAERSGAGPCLLLHLALLKVVHGGLASTPMYSP